MSKHGCVTHQLVQNIWLWGVEWLRFVSDVLGRMEHFEGEAVEELTLRQ